MSELVEKFKKVKIVIFDFDGVLVDDNPTTEEIIKLRKLLGGFVSILKSKEIISGIITAGNENKTIYELEDTGLDYIETASMDKVGRAEKILLANHLEYENLFFIGDGILDIPLLQKAGVSVAPSNARREVKRYVDIVLKVSGAENIITELSTIFKAIDN
ncbi:MAG: hypothetical protein SCALA702_11560 [Melioribacteraceae bacterium]|nr:MAG: hypothetical protein SCALA702_11560 [Melioribacteraceae bacterium]